MLVAYAIRRVGSRWGSATHFPQSRFTPVASIVPLGARNVCEKFVSAARDIRRRFLTPVAMVAVTANACFYILAGTPVTALAQDQVSVFAGGQSDYAGVGFIGATLALPGFVIGDGFAVRASAFSGEYDYKSSAEGQVKASLFGGQLEEVYQLSRNNFWSNVGLGVRNVDTGLTPFDQNNRRHGRLAEFVASLDGGKVVGPWRADWYGSYGTHLDDYAARVSFTHTLTATSRLGVEASLEGDPTYGFHRIGPYAGLRLGTRSEVQFSAGFSQESGRNAGSYLRTSIYRSF